MDLNLPAIAQTFALYALPVLLAITLHEAAHGYVARQFDDMTAHAQGRISLNPIRHIDPVGTIAVPALILFASSLAGTHGFLFGWAKPVPVNYSALRNPRKHMALVAAAGPAANLAMALLWAVLLKISVLLPENAGTLFFSLMAEAGTRDAFGHAQLGGVGPMIAKLVKDRLKYKYHWAVADYLQRAARHLASKTDVEQSYAVGKAAVQLALAGRNAVMPAIIRVSDKPYRWKIEVAPLDRIANQEKMLPRDFISRDGYGITGKARAYLAPLMRGEDPPPFRDGLPQYVRLKNTPVPRKLAADFRI